MSHDRESLPDRLHALGEVPVDPETSASHQRRMANASMPEPVGRRRFGPLAVGAAALVGFLAGSTGLAMAGALPDSAQNVAHDVLGVVQVDVPAGKDGKRGPCVAEAAKIEDAAEKQAAKDACPKGKPAGDDDPESPDDGDDAPGRSGDAPGRVKHDDDPCRGRPPWAGQMSNEERAELKAEHGRDDCVDDEDEDGLDDAPDERGTGHAPGRSGDGRVKHADDPCRGRPPWAGQMSKQERAELKAEHGRDGCNDDPSTGDDVNEVDEVEGD